MQEIFRLFWSSLAKLHSTSEISSFFSDLLTDTEEIMLAKRFMIAILLLRGKKPVEITKTLNVTYTTIGSVGAWLKNAKPETRLVLNRILGEQDWEKLLDRIDKIFDELPSSIHGSDWSRIGNEKWNRTLERNTRSSLR
jgi:uncharacterized protein YerC